MIFAVVDDGTFKIDKYVENTVDYARVGDHYYSDKAPGTAFLGIPLYAGLNNLLKQPVLDRVLNMLIQNEAFKSTLNPEGTGVFEQKVHFAIAQVVLTIFLAVIPTILICFLLFRIMKYFDSRFTSRFIIVIIYGLLTPVIAYANALYGHQLSAFFLFLAFYILFVNDQYSPWLLLFIGFLLSYSVITEYPTIMIAGILFLYATYRLYSTRKIKSIIWIIFSGALVAAIWMVYNTHIFGGPLNLGYQYSELWTEQHQTGFMSLTIPMWDAFWGITFSNYRGLFFISPILLLVIPGFIFWFRNKQYRIELVVVLSITASMLLFNSSSIMWWGGFAIGPRYLLPMLPFISISLIFPFLEWGGQKLFKLVTSLLIIWSIIANWGLAFAGQSFPPDTIRNPLLDYSLPNIQSGNIARNLGTIIGLSGLWSLVPLILLLGIVLAGYLYTNRPIKNSPDR
jgi:hypothetical protein